jgi:hypothetical protein
VIKGGDWGKSDDGKRRRNDGLPEGGANGGGGRDEGKRAPSEEERVKEEGNVWPGKNKKNKKSW